MSQNAQMTFDFQLPALDLSPTDNAVNGELSLEEQFKEFHARNPHVYEALRRLALQMKSRGRAKYGIAGLFEVLRWSYALQAEDPNSEFKLNNNHRAFYARLLMDQEPQLRGFFETREQRWSEHAGHN